MKRLLLLVAAVMSLGGAAQALADDAQIAPDELFKKLDLNGDGKLTASEIPQQHRKFFERLLRIGDADKNGELTREEFDRAFKQTEAPVTDISKVGGLGGGPPARAANFDPKRIFQTLDKNNDGKLTREEASGRPRILALFDRLDKDELTLEDLSKALGNGRKANGKKKKKFETKVAAASETTSEASNQPLPSIFGLLDTDHDGRLSQEELAKAGALFVKLDRNHDGFVDVKEFTAPPSKGEQAEMEAPAVRPGKHMAKFRNGTRMLQIIMRADADGDGKISKEEAPKQLQKHFAKIDTNGDGFLDRGELETWIKHRQKRLNGGQNSTAQNTGVEP